MNKKGTCKTVSMYLKYQKVAWFQENAQANFHLKRCDRESSNNHNYDDDDGGGSGGGGDDDSDNDNFKFCPKGINFG